MVTVAMDHWRAPNAMTSVKAAVAAILQRLCAAMGPAQTAFNPASHQEIADYDMMRPLTIAACFALTTVAFATMAQDAAAPEATPAATPAASAAPAAVKGNAEAGRGLAYTCMGCHGITGYKNAYPNFHVPKIGGQSAEYLGNALQEYKKGSRKHPTMQAQAQSFSDQQIADIAAFLSTLK